MAIARHCRRFPVRYSYRSYIQRQHLRECKGYRWLGTDGPAQANCLPHTPDHHEPTMMSHENSPDGQSSHPILTQFFPRSSFNIDLRRHFGVFFFNLAQRLSSQPYLSPEATKSARYVHHQIPRRCNDTEIRGMNTTTAWLSGDFTSFYDVNTSTWCTTSIKHVVNTRRPHSRAILCHEVCAMSRTRQRPRSLRMVDELYDPCYFEDLLIAGETSREFSATCTAYEQPLC